FSPATAPKLDGASLVRFVCRVTNRPRPHRFPHRLTRRALLNAALTSLGAGIGASAAAAYAVEIEPTTLKITDYRLTPAGWPQKQRLTIAAVADLHAGGPNMPLAQIACIVDETNALGADLIVVLGDYIATHRFVTE